MDRDNLLPDNNPPQFVDAGEMEEAIVTPGGVTTIEQSVKNTNDGHTDPTILPIQTTGSSTSNPRKKQKLNDATIVAERRTTDGDAAPIDDENTRGARENKKQQAQTRE